MCLSHIFASIYHDKNLPLKKWLASCLSIFLLLACLLFITSPAHSASKHGCAPPNPPPLANPLPAPPTVGSVFINEALSQPRSTWNCSEPAGTYSQQEDSWIELYNPGSQALNLYASHAEVSLDDGTTWYYLPFGSDIAPGGFLVVFPEENQIDPSSTWIVQLDIENITVDQAAIPTLQPDQSFARVPDGSQNWQFVGQPTIDASNDSSGQPVTPTPTRTPKTTASTGSGSSGASTPAGSGTQPAWSGVQLPATSVAQIPTDPSTQLLSQAQSTPAAQNSGPDSGAIVLIITLILLLLGTLVWCWKLFRAP
jgi:hypothetical protein